MYDPFAWSIPAGSLFGIRIRIHILFPFVAVALILRVAFQKDAPAGIWADMTVLMGLLFFSVLLHEFGHCFGARAVNGDAHEVLMWPLGGLASVDVPHTPRANLIMTAAGPAVNLVLGLACLGALYFTESVRPHFSPITFVGRWHDGLFHLNTWAGDSLVRSPLSPIVLLHQFFWVNYALFLLNVVLIGFPLDGGRIFQCVLWNYVGYRRATLAAVYAGFVTMFVVGLFAIIANEILPLCLAIFIYVACKQQWVLLETGGDESLFGYDFSQGYTSLEREDAPPPRRPRQSWWKRWLERRAARKRQREEETRQADERRLDELLDKVAREGMTALTDEERRFMKRVSDRYRNRQ